MKLLEYIKIILPQLICQFSLILFIDAILLTSSNLQKSKQDIIYLNIILLFIFVIFFLYGYIRMRGKYRSLTAALKEKRSIDYLLLDDDSFYSKILDNVIQLKNSEKIELVSLYKNSLDELNDYITKWVHEIKLPISVIELMLENTDELSIDTSRKFRTELERMKFHVNQVLYAGRAANYQEDLAVNEFSLQKAVKEALKLNSYFFMSKNIEIFPQNLDYSVINDERWVVYILEQILNNSSKYLKQDGKVEIYVNEDEKTIKLHIIDNGIGIPPTDINRIFEKGFTGENGKKASKSTGMGMYYSKKIADKLGLGLNVYSKEGEFTEFVLTFYKLSDYLKVTKM